MAALLGCLAQLTIGVLPPQPPNFSWDTVQSFMHSGNSSGPLNNATAKFMARFPLVTMAGFHGDAHGQCCNEDHITAFARSIKAANGAARVMYYQNTLINFPQTYLGRDNTTLPKSLLLHDKHGRLVYLGGCGSTHAAPNHTIYDHSLPAMREAWAANVVAVVKANPGLVDGVFCDRSGPIGAVATKDLECYEFEEGHLAAWDQGHWQAVADTQAALNALMPTAIVIGNHAEPTPGMHLNKNASTWNSKMYEHFTPIKPPTADYIPTGHQLAALVHDGERGGLITEVHVDDCCYGNDMYNRSLAAFLIAASEHSYYACTNGWGFEDGWADYSADYDRPLGKPLGPANKTETGWSRKFASGTEVWLDVQDETDLQWGSACIRWADGHVTAAGHLCQNGGGASAAAAHASAGLGVQLQDGVGPSAPAPPCHWPLTRGAATGQYPHRPQCHTAAAMAAPARLGGQRAVFDVTDFGATGDNRTDCTVGIKRAFAAASSVPGATVTFPAPGTYRSGPLRLNASTQHLTIEIAAGATLVSLGMDLARQGDWPTRPELASYGSKGRRIYVPFLWLDGVTNIVVQGGGVIDGNGTDWWFTQVRPPITPNGTCPDPSCKGCQGSCPSRPRTFLCENSSFVTLRGVTLRDSAFWTAHFYNSTDIVVEGLRVDNPAGPPNSSSTNPYVRQFGYGPNADGVDIEHSRRVLIQNSDIRCGDDAICLKAGFAPSAFASTADVLARNNTIFTSCPHTTFPVGSFHRNDGCGGMKLGYGTFSGIRNILFDGNTVNKAGLAIKLSSRLGMGGPITNISFHNTHVMDAGIAINVDMAVSNPLTPGAGARGAGTDPNLLSRVAGLSIINLTATQAIGCPDDVTRGAYCGGVGCLWGSHLVPLSNISLENVTISGKAQAGRSAAFADDARLAGAPVGWSCINSTAKQATDVSPPLCTAPAGAMAFSCSET